MSHRIKKRPTIDRNNYHNHKYHLLHSDKSTYFYKAEAINDDGRRNIRLFFNLRWSPAHQLMSKVWYYSTHGTLSIIPLVLSSFVLLLVLSLITFPNVTNTAFAETNENGDNNETVIETRDVATPSISLSLPDYTTEQEQAGITVQQEVSGSNSTGYLSIDFNVEAKELDKYDVYVQASNSSLIGTANKDIITSINGDTSYDNLKNLNRQWGYTVVEGAKANPETLTYKPIRTDVNTSAAGKVAESGSKLNVEQAYTLAFAANLTDASADHYKSNITLSVAAGAGEVTNLYSVTYNTNNSTGGTTPATQTAETNSPTYSFTTPEQNDLVRTGYGLAGWSENPNATSPEYALGETITLSKTSPNKTLYAIWQPGLQLISTMQEMTSIGCSGGTNIGGTKRLTDSRDNKQYWVTKLKDGNCWMTQNLDLDLSTTKELTEADTDFTESTTKSWAPASTAENTIVTTLNTTNWPNTNNIVRSWDPALGGDPTYCNDGNKTAGNCKTSGNPTTSINDGHDAQGNYYSWGAATAGQASSLTSATAGQESTQSICPKGWRLPKSGTDNGANSQTFQALTNAYDITSGTSTGNSDANLLKSPLYFVRGGIVNSGSLNIAGSFGYYWSSTADSASQAYLLNFSSSGVYPSNSSGRYFGYSIRCVAR